MRWARFLSLLTVCCAEGVAAQPAPDQAIDEAARWPMPLQAQDEGQDSATVLPQVRVTAGGEAESAYLEPAPTTATKLPVPLKDTPQTVDVVPRTLIEDRAALSVEQALRNVPGVGLSHGDGQRDQVTIRGFSAIGDQYVDGFRDDALYFRDLSNIERIEVLKGPASVLYGRGSAGGLINRVTKQPGPESLGSVSLRAGSFDTRRGELDLGSAAGAWQFRVTGALEDSGSYRDQQFLERHALAPSLAWQPSADTRLVLQVESLEDRRVTDFGVPAINGRPVDVDPGAYYGSANASRDDTSEADVLAGTLTFTQRFSDTWSLRNGLRYYDYDLDRNNTLPGQVRLDDGQPVVDLNRGKVRRQEHGLFNQIEITQKLTLSDIHHTLLYGLEVGQQDKDQRFFNATNVATVDLFNPVLVAVGPFPANIAPGTDNIGTVTTQALYVQDLIEFSPQWKGLFGLRFDVFEQEVNERRPNAPDLARTDRELSPRAGLVWQPDPVMSYYASVSRSFQPSAETFALSANNAELEPERTTGYEVGLRREFAEGRANLGLALFHIERTDIKTTDPANPSRLIPVGEQRTRGLEVSLQGEPAADWEVLAWYAFLDAEITRSTARGPGLPSLVPGPLLEGKMPSLTPEHAAQLWVKHRLNPNWSVGAGVNAVDHMYAAPDNVVRLPGYAIAEAALYYRRDQLDLALNVTNLFDREYFVSAHGSVNILNLPGAPRAALLTARWQW